LATEQIGKQDAIANDRFSMTSFQSTLLQKNRHPTETILHFFSRFFGFGGLLPSQPLAFQPNAPIPPLQKKSCQKHYCRFFAFPPSCHHRPMKIKCSHRKTKNHSATVSALSDPSDPSDPPEPPKATETPKGDDE
jgi:hypothetical protein